MPLHASSTCAHHQQFKIAVHSLWYHHTQTSEEFYRWPSRAQVQLCTRRPPVKRVQKGNPTVNHRRLSNTHKQTGGRFNIRKFLDKGKVHPRTGHEGPEGGMYSSTLPSTSALDGVGGQRHAPAALTPGKTRYPLCRRLGGPQGRLARVRKISPPPRFDPQTSSP